MDAERAGRVFGIGVLLVVLAIGAWLLIWGAEPSKTPAKITAEYWPTTSDAERMCREDVLGKLKAPGTAKFGGVRSTVEGDGVWRVTGWVDAQNSFGATIRSEWTCSATHRGGGRWRTLTTIR